MPSPVTSLTSASAGHLGAYPSAEHSRAAAAVGVRRDVGPVAARQQRRARKFRSTGKHAAPTQIEVAARKAGKTVPAAAMVGALAVTSHSHSSPTASQYAATLRSDHTVVTATTSLRRASKPAHPALLAHTVRAVAHPAAPRSYTVRPGDTLSGIAFRFYGSADAWKWLYLANSVRITNPNVIIPGWVLRVPWDIPPKFRGTGLDGDTTGQPHAVGGSSGTTQPQLTAAFHGTLGCSALEALWRTAGGAPSAQVTAASIAMAESSGNQYATGPYGERGYWQINPDHGALSTYDPDGNAKAAVIISDDGTNWSPWTTFVDGAYFGRC